MDRMPERLGAWRQTTDVRGELIYDHPDGHLALVTTELEDPFARDDLTPAEAVELLAQDFDPGTVRSCSRPPYHCVVGNREGQPAMLWGHDRSRMLLVALWPDEESRDLLSAAWAEAQ